MMKVKEPSGNPRGPKKLAPYLLGAVATIFLLILIKVFLIDHKEQGPVTVVHGPGTITTTSEKGPAPQGPILKILQNDAFKIKSPGNLHIAKPSFHSPQHPYYEKQRKIIREFKKKIHLDMKLPEAYSYLEYDLDEDVVALTGKTFSGDQKVAILATSRKPSTTEILNYLASSKETFPYLANHTFLPGKMQTIPAPANSGLSDLKVIPSTDSKGNSLYGAIATRKDGKGTYMFMMEAPRRTFFENEETLDKMLQSLSAKP